MLKITSPSAGFRRSFTTEAVSRLRSSAATPFGGPQPSFPLPPFARLSPAVPPRASGPRTPSLNCPRQTGDWPGRLPAGRVLLDSDRLRCRAALTRSNLLSDPRRPARPRSPSVRNSIGPDTCSRLTVRRDRRAESPRNAQAGPGTDSPWLRRQTLAALVATTLQYRSPGPSAHADPEPMRLLALAFVRLIRPLHVPSLIAPPSRPSGTRRRTTRLAHDHTMDPYRCARDNGAQRAAKYTSLFPARQSA